MEDRSSVGGATMGHDAPPVVETGAASPWQPPKSRVDRLAEDAARACVGRRRRDEALKILMVAYGAPITAFALRVLRDPEAAKDVRQQVFLDAFQGLGSFEGRGSLWSWLCSIAYHRCLDDLRRRRRAGVFDDFDVLDALAAPPDPTMDADQVARRRALELCLGKLSVPMRTQLLMRFFWGLSYIEIGETVGTPHGTVQVRMSRILPRLQRCLRDKGVVR